MSVTALSSELQQLAQAVEKNLSYQQAFSVVNPLLDAAKENIPEIASARVAHNIFVFMSASADIRVLDARLLRSEQLSTYTTGGVVSNVLGIAIGSGSNCLNAMRVNNRLILNNGSHRAYALRALGITHVPCAIQNITKQDELPLVATKDFLDNPNEFISHPRPPLLKDYFDKDLFKILPVTRKIRQIKVSYDVEVIDVPAV